MERYASLLIEFTFGVFLVLLLVRFFTSGGRFYLPFQFIATIRGVTDWTVRPLSFIPRIGKYETAALAAGLLLTIIQEIAVYSLLGVQIFQQPSISLLFIFTRGLLLVLARVIQLYIIVIIAGVICRWFQMRDPLSQSISSCYVQVLMPYLKLLHHTKFTALAPLLAFLVAQIMLVATNDALMRISSIFR